MKKKNEKYLKNYNKYEKSIQMSGESFKILL